MCPSDRMRILLIDDDEDEFVLVEEIAREIEKPRIELDWASTFDEGREQLNELAHDLYLLDYRLGSRTGLELLAEVGSRDFRPPIILLTGQGEQEVDVEAMHLGADDYLVKNRLDASSLERAIRYSCERRRATQALRASQERFALAVNGANDGIWDWDLRTDTAFYSERWRGLLGLEWADLQGTPEDWNSRIHRSDISRVLEELHNHLDGKAPFFQVEHRMLHQSGQYRWFLTRGVAVRDESNVAYRMAGSLTDVTERRESEEELLSHVSHELRTPLNAIYMFVSILNDGLAGAVSTTQREFLDRTLHNVEQLKHMIGDLMESSRIRAGKLEVDRRYCELGTLATSAVDAVRTIASQKKVSIALELDSDIPPVFVDPTRIGQVLLNLVENAVKFTPEGGHVRVCIGMRPGREDEVLFEVHDTGCGISEEGQLTVFERMHQEETAVETSRKGLGLGLYLCQELVKRHGGNIWVESELGQGSSFYFTVPAFGLARVLREIWGEPIPSLRPASLVEFRVAGESVEDGSPTQEFVLEDVRAVLQRTLREPSDLLLPVLGGGLDERRFHALVLDQAEAAEGLANRLHRMLREAPELAGTELETTAEVTELLGTTGPGEPEFLLKDLAQRVEDILGLPLRSQRSLV